MGGSGDGGPSGLAVAVRTLGCKVNQVEAEMIAAQLLGRGFELVEDEDDANVVVVNTCSVTGEADRKARKAVRRALHARREPAVVVTGCSTVFDAASLAEIGPRVVVESEKSLVAGRVAEVLGLPVEAGEVVAPPGAGGMFHSRAMVLVEDGCDAFCSYCVVPHLRGAPKSRHEAEILEEVRFLEERGVREVVLTGINIGKWREFGRDFADLVREVAVVGTARLRISSIEPGDITPDLLEVLHETPAVCPHLHIPLQSGSDPVLAAMRRPYTADEYARIVGVARENVAGLAVTTDVMVGFPGETEEDFSATMELCERVGFSKLHVFRFSAREGTDAAEMPHQVPPEVSRDRSERLRALGEELRERYARGRLGQDAAVLLEKALPAGDWEGTTEDYLKARVRCDGCAAGDIVPVTLKDWRGGVADTELRQDTRVVR